MELRRGQRADRVESGNIYAGRVTRWPMRTSMYCAPPSVTNRRGCRHSGHIAERIYGDMLLNSRILWSVKYTSF